MDFVPMAPILPEEVVGDARIEHFTVTKEESDRTRLRDMIGHRGEYVPAGDYVRLFVGKELVMSDTRFEHDTNRELLWHARGRVLIAGLGLGMVLVPILRAACVRQVTVVEKSADVIRLVEAHIRLACAEDAKKLTVIEADINTWTPPAHARYEAIYFDIWPNICADYDDEAKDLYCQFRRYKARRAWMGSWLKEAA